MFDFVGLLCFIVSYWEWGGFWRGLILLVLRALSLVPVISRLGAGGASGGNAPYGVDCRGCMTKETFETAVGTHLNVPKKKSQRAECACVLGTDIGAYDTCGHFCRYCYANYNRENVRRNMLLHNPESPLLVGGLQKGEVIHQAEQARWSDGQLTLF